MSEKKYSANVLVLLRKKKIRNLIKYCKMIPSEAAFLWDRTRKHDGLHPKRRGKRRKVA